MDTVYIQGYFVVLKHRPVKQITVYYIFIKW